jgi:mevalonate kinase
MEKSEKRFRSNGKLMLSGEYLVLHGAWSLAVPTRLGQSLAVKEIGRKGTLLWKTKVVSKLWMDCEIDPDSWQIIFTDKPDHTRKLVRVLKAATEISGDTEWLKGKEAVSEVEFDIEWGLGSSSSLISNIAWWAGIDPFRLSVSVSPGSGYDIACARSDQPLLYRTGDVIPEYKPIDFQPPFHERLAFVYLGRKQDSVSSIRNYLNKALVLEKDISNISAITEKLCRTRRLDEFEDLMREHEDILSHILGLPTVKQGLFQDYHAGVKSLGAWGGDFVMVTMHQEWPEVKAYFSAKGMETVIPYHKMVKGL